MIVRCVDAVPSRELVDRLGPEFYLDQAYGVSSGREYRVLAVDLVTRVRFMGSGAFLKLLNDDNQLVTVPLGMFEVVESTLPSGWRVGGTDTAVSLWPPEFYQEDFFESLGDGDAWALTLLNDVLARK